MDLRRTAALTLLGLLVVVLIVMLLAGILAPVLGRVKVEGLRADATARLRQFGVALETYVQDSGGFPPRHLDGLVFVNPQLKPVLLAAADPYPKGYARFVYDCTYGFGDPRSTELETSFEDVFATRWQDGSHPYISMLEPLDANYGLLVLRVYGDQAYRSAGAGCSGAPTRFSGPLLRLRRDGSVQRAQYRDVDTNGQPRVCYPALFTDVPPDTVCNRR